MLMCCSLVGVCFCLCISRWLLVVVKKVRVLLCLFIVMCRLVLVMVSVLGVLLIFMVVGWGYVIIIRLGWVV